MPTETGNGGAFEEVIDDQVYLFSKWGAEKQLLTMAQVSSIAGKALSNGARLLVAEKMPKEEQMALLSEVVDALTKGLGTDPKLTVAILKRLSSEGVLCDQKPFVWDLHFACKQKHLMKVVAANLQVQFGDFFSGVGLKNLG